MLLVVIIMICNDLWGFSIDPLILVITLQNRKTLFCVFLCFRNFPKLKLTWDFSGVNILSPEPPREEEVSEMGPRGQTSTGGMGPWLGRATHTRLGLGAPITSILSPDAQLDLKKAIYRLALAIVIQGGGKT
jgi:hypothetical protein